MEERRIYVGELPAVSTEEDVKQLFSKIAPVLHVYIPGKTATGLRRAFAVVQVQADQDTLKKCVRTFNGCHWKGSKIRVDVAKEFYKERLEREKKETAEVTTHEIPCAPRKVPAEVLSERVWKIRRLKNEHVYVCARGGGNSSTGPKAILPCGRRIVFTDNGLPQPVLSTAPLQAASKVEPVKSVTQADASTETSTPVSAADVPSATVTEPAAPKGGGKRVGFGAIASLPPREAADANARESCGCGTAPPSSGHTSSLTPAPEDGVAEFTSAVPAPGSHAVNHEQMEVVTESGRYEDLSDSDNEACVGEGELEDDALNAERERQRKIAAMLVATDGDTAAAAKQDPVKAAERRKADIRASSGAAFGAPRFDPSAAPQTTAALELSEEEIRRRDEAKRLSEEAETDRRDTDTTKEFADVDKLKGIFHRQGGFTWGDDGTLNDMVARSEDAGRLKEDSLYLEAEKLGIDVREGESAQDVKKTGMVFGFFDSAPEQNKDTTTEAAVDGFSFSFGASDHTEMECDGALSAGATESHVEEERKIEFPSLVCVFSTAASFYRDMSEGEIVDAWKKNREKLSIDYKRKSKEARKKAESFREKNSSRSQNNIYAPRSNVQSNGPKRGRSERGGSGRRKKRVRGSNA